MDVVLSRDGIPIRLTGERWTHIVEEHNELAGLRLDVLASVAEPYKVVAGRAEEKLAVKEYEPGKWLVVVYKEVSEDGFVITAFLTSRLASLNRRRQLWPPQ